jgi:hypothetical protein
VLVVKIRDGIIMRHPFRRVSKNPGVVAGQANWVSGLGNQALLRSELKESYQDVIEFMKQPPAGVTFKLLGVNPMKNLEGLMRPCASSELERLGIANGLLGPAEAWVIYRPVSARACLFFYVVVDKSRSNRCICRLVEVNTGKEQQALVAELANFPSESELANSLN